MHKDIEMAMPESIRTRWMAVCKQGRNDGVKQDVRHRPTVFIIFYMVSVCWWGGDHSYI